jgi:hypothetical protein
MNTPHSQPSPPQGGKGLIYLWVSLLGCFASLAMTQVKQGPLRPFGPLPPEGEDLPLIDLPPLGEVPAKPG